MRITHPLCSQLAVDNLKSVCICPISHDIMKDPVVAADGHTYERSQIVLWLARCGEAATSPMTGAPLADRRLQVNQAVKTMIASLADFEPSCPPLPTGAVPPAPAAIPPPALLPAQANAAAALSAAPGGCSAEEAARARASRFPDWHRSTALGRPHTATAPPASSTRSSAQVAWAQTSKFNTWYPPEGTDFPGYPKL